MNNNNNKKIHQYNSAKKNCCKQNSVNSLDSVAREILEAFKTMTSY